MSAEAEARIRQLETELRTERERNAPRYCCVDFPDRNCKPEANAPREEGFEACEARGCQQGAHLCGRENAPREGERPAEVDPTHVPLRLTELEADVAESWLTSALDGAENSTRSCTADRVARKLRAAIVAHRKAAKAASDKQAISQLAAPVMTTAKPCEHVAVLRAALVCTGCGALLCGSCAGSHDHEAPHA